MGWEHTKGKRKSPKNLRQLPHRKSCDDCALLDWIGKAPYLGEVLYSCRRPSGPTYHTKDQATKYKCNGWTHVAPENIYTDEAMLND